jgi:bifunctional non-homologous end joining protein LigD
LSRRCRRCVRADIVWVEPRLVCEVEFAEWTHDGRLRAPSYKGLREDKEVEEVHRELPIETEIRRGKRILKLSNLDKIFFPESGLTKATCSPTTAMSRRRSSRI